MEKSDKVSMTDPEYKTLQLGNDATFVKMFLDTFYDEARELLMREIEETTAMEKEKREDCYIRLKHLKIFYDYIMSKIMAAENVVLAVQAREAANKELAGDGFPL